MGKNMARKRRYSAEDIRRAAGLHFIYGSLTRVSREMDIPKTTLVHWRDNKEEWALELDRIRTEKNLELDRYYTAIIDKSAEELTERLVHGDEVIGKDGSATRRKVSARDLAIIGGIAFDKRALLRSQTPGGMKTEAVEDRIKELVRIFQESARTSALEEPAPVQAIPIRTK